MNQLRWTGSLLAVVLVAGVVLTAYPAYAETIKSNNYRFDESSMGTGGLINSGSANFGITEATGDLGVGESSSSNYQLQAGSKTDPSPVLAFAIGSGTSNFGLFTASAPSVTTASFSVMNYTSYGYTVQVLGNTPTNGAHAIDAMSTLDTSQSGKEQFGLNLVANTSPTSIGANPDNGSFGYGTVVGNYSTPNKYYFSPGDTIAQSPKSSGITTYTITYLVNVAGMTPGGQYKSDQTLVVLATF